MQYDPTLPDGVSLPAGFHVETDNPRYKALHEVASREKWSQASFSAVLGLEAQRVAAEHAKASPPAPAPAPAPAPPALPPNFDKLSAKQQFAYSLAKSAAPRRG